MAIEGNSAAYGWAPAFSAAAFGGQAVQAVPVGFRNEAIEPAVTDGKEADFSGTVRNGEIRKAVEHDSG